MRQQLGSRNASSYCSECLRVYKRRRRQIKGNEVRASDRAWYARNQERQQLLLNKRRATPRGRRDQRERHLRYAYGITSVEFNEMLQAQDRKCAICGCGDKKLCVDHCHVDNVIRGLLCRDCNAAIGLLRESPSVIRAAALYLEKKNG
jgi:hypothetical protein